MDMDFISDVVWDLKPVKLLGRRYPSDNPGCSILNQLQLMEVT